MSYNLGLTRGLSALMRIADIRLVPLLRRNIDDLEI